MQKLKKSLGQNFLNNPDIIEKIIEKSNLNTDDVVLEIGPGDGALTKSLIKNSGKVIAFEIDTDLIQSLEDQFTNADNFELINQDIRKINLPQFLIDNRVDKYKVIANLPYYITSFIIRFFLETVHPPSEIIFMVQKEVAERIVAQPGKMSILSVAVQYYGEPEYLFTVTAENFTPIPKVDSAVIRISNIQRTNKRNKIEDKLFFQLVKSGFSAKRKTLVNNLSNSLHLSKIDVIQKIKKINLDQNVRAQELSINDWQKLVKLF